MWIVGKTLVTTSHTRTPGISLKQQTISTKMLNIWQDIIYFVEASSTLHSSYMFIYINEYFYRETDDRTAYLSPKHFLLAICHDYHKVLSTDKQPNDK